LPSAAFLATKGGEGEREGGKEPGWLSRVSMSLSLVAWSVKEKNTLEPSFKNSSMPYHGQDRDGPLQEGIHKKKWQWGVSSFTTWRSRCLLLITRMI